MDYGNVAITWTPAPGATGYTVDVQDLDQPLRYLADYITNIPADSTNFTLTTDRITKGHHYLITVTINAPIDPDVGYGVGTYMPPVHVQIGQSSIIPLNSRDSLLEEFMNRYLMRWLRSEVVCYPQTGQ